MFNFEIKLNSDTFEKYAFYQDIKRKGKINAE
jgi:hypothetical protein